MIKKFLILLLLFFPHLSFATTEQVLVGGDATQNLATLSNRYVELFSGGLINSSETTLDCNANDAVTFSNLNVKLSVAPGSGGATYTINLRKNATTTALTCTVADPNTTCSDTTHSVTVAAGDLMDIEVVPANIPTASKLTFNMIVTGPATGQSIYCADTSNNLSNSATQYNTFSNSQLNQQATENLRYTQVPTSGTFKNLRIHLPSSPGSGKSFTFTVRKNGSDTSVTCAVSDANTTCSDTSNSFTVAAGDNVNIKSVPSGTPTQSIPDYSLSFIADTDGEFFHHANLSTASNSANNYVYTNGSGWNGTEANKRYYSAAITAKKIYVYFTSSPGSGKSWQRALRVNGSTSALTCTVSDTNTTCNNTNDVSIANSDLVNLISVPSGTPAQPNESVSILMYRIAEAPGTDTYSGRGVGRGMGRGILR